MAVVYVLYRYSDMKPYDDHLMHMKQKHETVADPEGGRGGTAPSQIGQNLAKLAPFLPIFASMPP